MALTNVKCDVSRFRVVVFSNHNDRDHFQFAEFIEAEWRICIFSLRDRQILFSLLGENIDNFYSLTDIDKFLRNLNIS